MQYINLKKKNCTETRRIVVKKEIRMQYSPHNKNEMVNNLFPSLMKSLSSLCLEKRQVVLDEGKMKILMC